MRGLFNINWLTNSNLVRSTFALKFELHLVLGRRFEGSEGSIFESATCLLYVTLVLISSTEFEIDLGLFGSTAIFQLEGFIGM